jgi:hypothetical protein
MTASAQQVEPEPEARLVRVRATKSSDYINSTLHPNWSLENRVEVPVTLPAEAVEQSGGPRPTFRRRPPAGLRPAVLVRRLAGDLALNGKPALRRWLQAAEARYGPMPEDGAVEMVQLWHIHWDLLDHDERMESMDELFEQWAREDGVTIDKEAVAAAAERMTAEAPEVGEHLAFREGVDDEE